MKKLLVLMALLAPITAMADDVCDKIISDITRNYNVSKLEVMHNGNPRVSQDLVACNYKAVTPEMWGDRPVLVSVLLNTTNNRFTVEVR